MRGLLCGGGGDAQPAFTSSRAVRALVGVQRIKGERYTLGRNPIRPHAGERRAHASLAPEQLIGKRQEFGVARR